MPAAAVIPAPVAYIKVVAVKTLVVERWAAGCKPCQPAFWEAGCLCGWPEPQDFYFDETRVFKAGARPGYSSME